jgi:hypothetical protein
MGEAIARCEEITPALLKILEDAAENPESYASDPDSMIVIFTAYLLAQFRETRAYPVLLRICALSGHLPFDLLGEGSNGRILASVSGGDISGFVSLIENEQADPYIRWAALEGLVSLVIGGLRTRDEIIGQFRHLFQTLKREPSPVWDGFAGACCDLWPDELMEDLRLAYDEGLIWSGSIDWEDIVRDRHRGLQGCLEFARKGHHLITDVVSEMEWWYCFNRNEPVGHRPPAFKEAATLQEAPADLLEKSYYEQVETYHRTEPKVGRNDPCPCGSGNKFKKCCGITQ